MKTETVPTFTATIYVGMKERSTGNIANKREVLDTIECYVELIGLCVTVTDIQFFYSSGDEHGIAVGLINYPRFPSSPELIKAHALALAEILLKTCKQLKVSVVMPTETIMISAE